MSQHPRGSARASADTAASFPNPVDITERPGSGARALSMASSRMTDPMDEEGEEREELAAVGGASPKRQPPTLLGRVQGLTGPVGEPGVPPSRPSTAATGKSGVASQAAYPKRLPSAVGGLQKLEFRHLHLQACFSNRLDILNSYSGLQL
jgi:hypothetical protein